ncbi:MAG: acyl-(acyl-carrier-protein)--UDP-N-acetylglucosamine O-acyltransferase [Devosia sp.]|uniref:acyl-ACP--UDP-N-acetylglucosamine O-acyltransferase n=1 Tax=Devosia sp. TaxID=1871048 RepID=UPI00262771D9|nr:acyl-ACP--UDP-N-acetylglucosamine O-acyltransferase [Devosia sp.]MDB5542839.1 acyl-(acyl-carrier-protein)--UDP-N-acetylglucosamine O-acyltransferase [Devosia sp.]
MTIHPSAIVEPGAVIGAGAKIGPFCVVGGDVTLGDGVELISHAVVTGRTKIGARTVVFPFASVGHRPQDLKYAGEPSTLAIGADCTIREHVTINPGTAGGGMKTVIGDHCLLMIGVHIGHDCILGDHIILSNNTGIAGHCVIDDYVIMSGHSGSAQFVHIGAHAFIGGMTKVEKDVIPYGTVLGNPAALSGVNLVGLKRRGFDREAIHRLRTAYRMIFASEGTLRERLDDASEMFPEDELVQDVVRFIVAAERPLTLPGNVPVEE